MENEFQSGEGTNEGLGITEAVRQTGLQVWPCPQGVQIYPWLCLDPLLIWSRLLVLCRIDGPRVTSLPPECHPGFPQYFHDSRFSVPLVG